MGWRQVSLGALVDSKVAVTTLDDVSRMRLDFSIPETLVNRVKVDSPVQSTSLAIPGRNFDGKVALIDTRIDPVTRSAKLTAIIPNVDGLLKPGMFMNVSLQVAARDNALLAPEEAIVAEGPRQIAFVVKDGKIERRVVTIGQRQQGKVEVVRGLLSERPSSSGVFSESVKASRCKPARSGRRLALSRQRAMPPRVRMATLPDHY